MQLQQQLSDAAGGSQLQDTAAQAATTADGSMQTAVDEEAGTLMLPDPAIQDSPGGKILPIVLCVPFSVWPLSCSLQCLWFAWCLLSVVPVNPACRPG